MYVPVFCVCVWALSFVVLCCCFLQEVSVKGLFGFFCMFLCFLGVGVLFYFFLFVLSVSLGTKRKTHKK